MNRIIKKEDIGKFGEMVAGTWENEKRLFGQVLYVDHFGAIIFLDSDDITYKFLRTDIVSFEEKEFKGNFSPEK
jgi:hypothetical protein